MDIYLAAAEILNETFGRTVLPIGLPSELKEPSPRVLERTPA